MSKFPRIAVFMATGCVHCEALEPIWKEAKKYITDQNQIMEVVLKNMSENNEDADKYSVNGFPTIQIHKTDDPADVIPFSGPRTLDNILDFAEENGIAVKKRKTKKHAMTGGGFRREHEIDYRAKYHKYKLKYLLSK